MSDDIIVRFEEMLDGPIPHTVDAQDLRDAIAEIERLRGQLEPIVRAFVVPGRFPGYHEYVKRGLKKEWPIMYSAIEKAALHFQSEKGNR